MARKQLHPPSPRLIRLLYSIGLGPVIGRMILLLTTTGRKSGLPRTTPLQYEDLGGAIYVASANGRRADWFKNIEANPRVHLRIKSSEFDGLAQTVTDPRPITDFLQLRLERHPKMIGAILRSEGLPSQPTRRQLEQYAGNLAMVIIHRIKEDRC
ncbi:MAG TPA: nitroreductase family deazaflavin-dependent oxidoreductase [Anaerolineales bacterium]|nr:nitroreductase family deazaflavin-dependent oxidoreductase [Anaerolineales bacterium]